MIITLRAVTNVLVKAFTNCFAGRDELKRSAPDRKTGAMKRTSLLARARTAAVVLGLLGGAVAAPSSASAWTPDCGSSKFIEQIELRTDAGGGFIVVIHPSDEARDYSAWVPDQRPAVVEEWHAVQACVPGLYGDLADSIWQQLECHQWFAWAWNPLTGAWATGDTFDLESYRPKLADPGLAAYVSSKCGGYLGVEPGTTFSSPHRPDAGVTDLEHAFDNIA